MNFKFWFITENRIKKGANQFGDDWHMIILIGRIVFTGSGKAGLQRHVDDEFIKAFGHQIGFVEFKKFL